MRYFLFSGMHYEPGVGMDHYAGSSATLDEAKESAEVEAKEWPSHDFRAQIAVLDGHNLKTILEYSLPENAPFGPPYIYEWREPE
jgi:hypothetical protein